jgi:hypothetical protein
MRSSSPNPQLRAMRSTPCSVSSSSRRAASSRNTSDRLGWRATGLGLIASGKISRAHTDPLGDRLQFGQARPTHCVTILISLSPFDELIRSSCTAHISSEMMEGVMPCAPSTRSSSTALSSHRMAATSAAVQSRDRETDRGSGIDDRRNNDGRFPGVVVIAARLTKS